MTLASTFVRSLRLNLCRLLEKDLFVTQFMIRGDNVFSGDGVSIRWAAAFLVKLVSMQGGAALALVHLTTRDVRLVYVEGKGAGIAVIGDGNPFAVCAGVFDKYSRARGYASIYHDPDPAI
jgi:hypothetical protein